MATTRIVASARVPGAPCTTKPFLPVASTSAAQAPSAVVRKPDARKADDVSSATSGIATQPSAPGASPAIGVSPSALAVAFARDGLMQSAPNQRVPPEN